MENDTIVQCPACNGSGVMKDTEDHPCRCCDGLGEFFESEMLARVKDMKTWPDSIRREHGFKV